MINRKCSRLQRGLEEVCCNYTPVVITVCFVSAMLLMYIVDAKYNIDIFNGHAISIIEFNILILKETVLFYGITASLWEKTLLLFIAGISIFPYALARRGRYTTHSFDSWVKLGLVLGIAICFYSTVAVMDDIFEFLVMSLEGADEDVFRFGRPLYITYTQQNRLLLTSPQNILLPLSMCILLHFLAEKQRTNRVVSVVCILLTILSIHYLNPHIWVFFVVFRTVVWKSLALLCLALVIGCISSMRRKDEVYSKTKGSENSWCGLLLIGIIILALCGNVVLKMSMAALGFRGWSYAITDYDVATMEALIIILTVGLLYAKRKKMLKSPSFRTVLKFLPVLLLVLFSLIADGYFSSKVIFRGKHYEMLKGLVDFLRNSDTIGEKYSYRFGGKIWFFNCIACLIYVLYVLYDYGMKDHPKLYLGITVVLIVMANIPNFTISIGSGIESVSVVNILFGLLSPVLIITFGLINRRKKSLLPTDKGDFFREGSKTGRDGQRSR